MLKGIIFDMDGVISDSERLYVEVKNEVLGKFDIHDIPLEYHLQFVGTTHEYQWEHMSKRFHLEHVSTEEYLEVFYEVKNRVFEEEGVVPIEGALDFIARLKEHGYKLAIASSSTIDEIEMTLQRYGIRQQFDAITSGWEVEHGKPAPDIFLLAAKRLGLEPAECMVIEDSPNGAKGAIDGGIFCLGFRNAKFPLNDMKMADAVYEKHDEMTIERLEALFAGK